MFESAEDGKSFQIACVHQRPCWTQSRTVVLDMHRRSEHGLDTFTDHKADADVAVVPKLDCGALFSTKPHAADELPVGIERDAMDAGRFVRDNVAIQGKNTAMKNALAGL